MASERQVGPAALAVLRHVADHPGCSRGGAVVAVAPDRPSGGYRAVEWCQRNGLVRATQRPSVGGFNQPPRAARQVLHLTAAGEAALAAESEAAERT